MGGWLLDIAPVQKLKFSELFGSHQRNKENISGNLIYLVQRTLQNAHNIYSIILIQILVTLII